MTGLSKRTLGMTFIISNANKAIIITIYSHHSLTTIWVRLLTNITLIARYKNATLDQLNTQYKHYSKRYCSLCFINKSFYPFVSFPFDKFEFDENCSNIRKIVVK